MRSKIKGREEEEEGEEEVIEKRTYGQRVKIETKRTKKTKMLGRHEIARTLAQNMERGGMEPSLKKARNGEMRDDWDTETPKRASK